MKSPTRWLILASTVLAAVTPMAIWEYYFSSQSAPVARFPVVTESGQMLRTLFDGQPRLEFVKRLLRIPAVSKCHGSQAGSGLLNNAKSFFMPVTVHAQSCTPSSCGGAPFL
jgi:hypothetical protein